MSTRELAGFLSRLRYEDLPPEVVQQAKRAVLDFTGVSIFVGAQKPWGQIIADFATSEGSCQSEATVLGYRQRTLASKAALANGTMALGFEYEDLNLVGGGHPYTACLPAALALAERERASGKDLLTAVVVGYEAMARVGLGLGPVLLRPLLNLGFYPPGLNATFGAAAAAGKILKLDESAMCQCIGLAAMQTCGLLQGHAEGAMARRLYGGKGAENGVTAALLAQRGFTGPEQGLEGQFGYLRVLTAAAGAEPDIAQLTQGLGSFYQIMNAGFKAYPTNGSLHAPVEALLELRQEYGFHPDDVEEIVAYWHESNPLLRTRHVPSPVTAQYSLLYCLSVALLRGRITVDDFTDEAIKDAEVLRLMDKVRPEHDPTLLERTGGVAMGGRVTVRLRDGRELTREVLIAKGYPGNLMNEDEHRRKFDDLVLRVFHREQADEIYRTIKGLEQVSDVNAFTALLRPS
ncbi:MAG: MmgE/PrpD family protein [Chloroflexi bacterium]|nr:MmgE/PrpD family protein [Chloroflexota bacterium]